MRQELALDILAKIMQWSIERAREEFSWLSLMSRLKYDRYLDFVAGMRFIENLIDWLQQFDQADREAAYLFVRNELVFIGSSEMRHLVEQFYFETVCWRILSAISSNLRIPRWQIYTNPEAMAKFEELLKRILFLGLSDGAQIDTFRRANVGTISNEQVVAAYQIDDDKWQSLLKDLRKNTGNTSAKFAFVFLIDDFAGSGFTLLRKENEKWKGKMVRFWKNVKDNVYDFFTEDWILCVHHYLGTHTARSDIQKRNDNVKQEKNNNWFREVKFSFGMTLPQYFPFDKQKPNAFNDIIQKYYDSAIQNEHTEIGGSGDMRYGFHGCALPLVLEHNTPNNSLALIWAESEGMGENHAMRPLFRRRQRHI